MWFGQLSHWRCVVMVSVPATGDAHELHLNVCCQMNQCACKSVISS